MYRNFGNKKGWVLGRGGAFGLRRSQAALDPFSAPWSGDLDQDLELYTAIPAFCAVVDGDGQIALALAYNAAVDQGDVTRAVKAALADGGRIIDTPGIKGFGLIDINGAELWHYFPEMIGRSGACRFYNCTHTHEPGCAVTAAVMRGEIAPMRYESYLKMLDDDDKYRK